MDRYNSENEDPVKFDSIGLEKLKDLYKPLLVSVKHGLDDDPWFNEIYVSKKSIAPHLDWNRLGRHFLTVFAIGDALGINSEAVVDFSIFYAKHRLIPIQLYDFAIDNILYSYHSDSRLQIANIGLVNLLSQLNGGYIANTQFNKGDVFWKKYCELTGRVVKLAIEELGRRFDKVYLESPELVLKLYGTDQSPLLRSSTLETPFWGLKILFDAENVTDTWLKEFEQARQLLDDLGDLWEDILMGRVTYPILLSLKSYGINSELEKLIVRLWNAPNIDAQNTQPSDFDREIFIRFLNDTDSLSLSTKKVSQWLDKVESEILRQQFMGNIEGILILIDLKRAYLSRLIQANYKDQAPSNNILGL